MDPSPTDALPLLGGLSLISFAVFSGLLGSVRKHGGKVRTDFFALPELLISLVLTGFFAALIAKSLWFSGDAEPVKFTVKQVLPGTLPFIVLAVGLTLFLRHRGVRLWNSLGCDRVTIPAVLVMSVALVFAAFPLLLAAGLLMQIFLQQSAQEQELVSLFREVTREQDQTGIATIFIAGAIIAPVCEEFLFRGFFYGAFKRYLGPIAAALITAALFAGVHLNLAALPSLFLLALCFTIAYEATGSLLVPMAMHATFNSLQLGFLYYVAKSVPA